tara:strand:+ start:1594 stop:2742 length:1149 start_codon:yes stop_codon:yes gene_type:complete
MYKINGNPEQFADLDVFHKLSRQFLPYAQEKLGFNKPVGINLLSDPNNAKNPLGKTAYYDPNKMEVTVFVDKRHVKDILRSMSHELVHHTQNCRGEFDGGVDTGPGYAQEDGHMRKMEEEAYLEGQMLLRDFEDNLKKENKVMAEVKNPGKYKTGMKAGYDTDGDGTPDGADSKPKDGSIQEEGIFSPNHYCVHHGGVQMEGEIKLGRVINHNWDKSLKEVTKYDMIFENGKIIRNIPFSRILVTEASLANEHVHGKRDDDLEEEEKLTVSEEAVNMLDPKPGQEKEAARLRAASKKQDAKLQPKFDELEKEVSAMKKSDKAKRAAKDAADRILPDEEVAKLTRPLPDEKDRAVAKPALEENWTKKNKDQLLFERLIEKWIK